MPYIQFDASMTPLVERLPAVKPGSIIGYSQRENQYGPRNSLDLCVVLYNEDAI